MSRRRIPKLESGLYYIVLVDLVGSTKSGVTRGNAVLMARTKQFVAAVNLALTNAKMSHNTGRVLKTSGDGVLMIFRHFPDVIQWRVEFDGALYLNSVKNEELGSRLRACGRGRIR